MTMAEQETDGMELQPYFLQNTSVNIVNDLCSYPDSQFNYFYKPLTGMFPQLNNDYSRIVGYNSRKEANCVVFFWGKGRLYLHAEPRALSNYFLLSDNNYQYFLQLLQLLPEKPQHVYVDEYYNKRQYKAANGEGSFFATLQKYPALAWAFWIIFFSFLLYIILNLRRRQRPVPVVKPVVNSSVQFAEAIAGLYLKKDSNKTISDKMMMYFNDNIRSSYYLQSAGAARDFEESLSRKSGVPLEQTQELFAFMRELQHLPDVSNIHLEKLNSLIQAFNKKRK